MKDKATFVAILNKYLDPYWSDQDLADAVMVKNRSTTNHWKDVGHPTMPQGENLDNLVRVLKITDPKDMSALYEAATGFRQLAAIIQPQPTPVVPEPLPQLSPLHLDYLRSWFGQPWATVTLADIIEGNHDEVSLLDIYVPLQVDFGITIVTANHTITEWWATPDDLQRDGDERTLPMRTLAPGDIDALDPTLLAEMRAPQRRWPDLNVDEAGLQQIVDRIQRKILERRDQGEETKDGKYSWYMEAHDAASVQPHFVLLGDPGSGKSSFVRHLTLCMAGELRRRAGDDDAPANASIAALREWLLDAFTPIYVELRELFPTTQTPYNGTQQPPAEHLWAHLRSKQLVGSLAAFEPELRRLCAKGEAILLLDGLDEVSQAGSDERRNQIKGFVSAMVRTYPKLRIIITSRSHAYRRGDWALDGFGRAEMRPLALDRLRELATALFPVAQTDGAIAPARAFVDSLQAAEKAHLLERKLYATPLFFTLLAALWLPTQQLPSSRAELLRKGVDLLLKRWTRRRLPDRSVAERLGVLVTDDNSTVLREVLESLALKVHAQAQHGSDSTLFEVGLLLGILYEARCQVQIEDVPDYLTQHAGILVSPEHGRFYILHRSFQEHLAAAALICPTPAQHCPPIPREMHFPEGIVRLTLGQPELWENVVQLAADELFTHPQRSLAGWQLTTQLCEPYLDSRRPAAAAFLALQIAERHKLFALDIPRFDSRQAPFAALRETAMCALTDVGNFTPEQRNFAGDLLARKPEHDRRPGVGQRTDGLPDIAWCKVPATDAAGNREFFYQEGKHRDLPDFWIARYPVTYAQFQTFVDAPDGYRNSRWWQGLAEDRSKQGKTRWEQRWPIANRPRENVTWVEAVAFCHWLSAQAVAHPELLPAPEMAARLGDGWSIRLPTEWEWEKAARGWDERSYPWGGQEYKAGHANVDETGQKVGPNYLQQTSAVGIYYPQGASPFGAEEMSGNVWEFCLNEYHNPANVQESGAEWRAVRGGSWYQSPEGSSVSARGYGGGFDYNVIGFRVVFAASP